MGMGGIYSKGDTRSVVRCSLIRYPSGGSSVDPFGFADTRTRSRRREAEAWGCRGELRDNQYKETPYTTSFRATWAKTEHVLHVLRKYRQPVRHAK